MEEDKVNSEISDKRKIEDDNVGPKPNPKRIKLVRPVFSPVTKPTISSITEINKSAVQPTEITKSCKSLDKVPNLVDVSQPIDKVLDKPEPIKKLIEVPETAKNALVSSVSQPVEKPTDKPVVSPVSQPMNKPIDKPEPIKKLIELPETAKKPLVSPAFQCMEKPIDKPEPIKKLIELPETVQKSVEKPNDKPEAIKNIIELSETVKKPVEKPYDKPEAIKKLVVATVVPEEQIDVSSDALDIQNIFSEETKKELEHLKKNIFKIEDDGSSSENDGQPKRPRLKRPTFVTSAVENKFESINTKTGDKIVEASRLDLIKSVSEDNINKIDRVIEKEAITIATEEKIINVTKTNTVDTKMNDEERNNIVTENMTEKSIITEDTNKLLEKKSVITDNICALKEKSIENDDKIKLDHNLPKDEKKMVFKNLELKEKSTLSNSDHKSYEKIKCDAMNVDTILEEKTAIEHLSVDTKKVTEIKYDHNQIKQNVMKADTSVQENDVKKENINKLIKTKLIDNNKIDQTTDEVNIDKKETTEEKKVLPKENDETYIETNDGQKFFLANVSVILERIDNKRTDEVPNEKSTSHVKLGDDKTIVESKKVKSIEMCPINYNTNNEVKTETNIVYKVTGIKQDSQEKKIVENIKVDEFTSLKKKKQIADQNSQGGNENKGDCDTLSKQLPSIDLKQKHEEHETQLFKSAILKAALMSKKSPESSLISSSEVHDQPETNIYPPALEIKKTEILPTIVQDGIVKTTPFDHRSDNSKKLQNKILSTPSEINIPSEACTSICLNENISVNKHDDPPKWGSAKMNEVEKFLNDSNVTITPIGKSQEMPKLGKITLKLPKVGNPEIKSETTVRPNVKSELIKKITNKQNAMGDSPLKSSLPHPSKSFNDLATIRPAPKLSAEQVVLLEQQILNTPKKRGRPSKVLSQQKQLLLQYQQQQQQKVQEGGVEDDTVFHVPLFDMEDMSGGASMFDSFDASTPKRGKSIRGKGSRGRRGRGGGRSRGGSDSDTASNSRQIDDEKEKSFHEELNQDEETKQVAMIEAERLRKEEERERKLEARKKKLKERNDLLKEKKMKKKQKAEERRLQWHEKKRLMQEEKLKAAEMKKSLPPPQNFDDETRMSADCSNSRSQTPARNFTMGEDDLSISGATNDSMRMKKGRMEVIDLESNKTLTVDQIAEYQWPLEGGELYMIQEQISNFLGVKSFKRKYPGLKRRNVEAEERTFLCDSGLVAETLCDLGLTVLYSSEVLDVMYADFPEKYEELREYMRLKHAKELSNRQRALMTVGSNTDGSKLDIRDRAMEAVANWNANLNKSRLESRKCSMDMQTFIVHYPKNKCKKMAVPKPKIGSYPLALLPGQFCDYYATYSSEDLHYLPINTVMYGPLKSVDKDFPVSLSSQSESDDSSSDDSSDSDDSIDDDGKLEKNGLDYGPSDKKGADCKLCCGTAEKNKNGTVEPLIHCSKCLTIYHPTCLDMTLEMIPYIKRYNWQCNECKSCAQCKEVADEDKMLFCDLCDRGYHIYCVGLRRVPEGRWHCQECAMCSSCGVSDPGPGDSKWFYEFKKTEKSGSKVYCRTLCAPCSRLWKKGHYCPNCMRCYSIKNIERMTQCNSCDRYLHSECISENVSNRQVVACTICEEKAVSRLLTTVPRSLIKV